MRIGALPVAVALQSVFLPLCLPIPTLAGVIGVEDRQAIGDYARDHHMDVDQARQTFAASGRIMCDFSSASAFLIYRNDIVVTARHVLFNEPDQGSYAGSTGVHRCGFEVSDGKTSTWHKIDIQTITYLPDKQRNHTDRFDWVVMRLFGPVDGITPYQLPSASAKAGEAVTAATIRQNGFPKQDWNERVLADCAVRATPTIDAIPAAGVKIDCSLSPGASGGAVLRKTADGYEAIGIVSSGTLADCSSFDASRCYSFAVGLTGPVIDAIKSLAR